MRRSNGAYRPQPGKVMSRIRKIVTNGSFTNALKTSSLSFTVFDETVNVKTCADSEEDAVPLLPKNTWLVNGHNVQGVSSDLPLYLPGNGGLLLAAGMMAAGWDGDSGQMAPGFPADGTWVVEAEGLYQYFDCNQYLVVLK